MEKSHSNTTDKIKMDLLCKGVRTLFVESVAITTETSFINTANFNGYVAVSENFLFVYRNTLPFGDYALIRILNLKEIALLKSGKSLILRQYYVEIKDKKRKYTLTCLSEPCMNAIVHAIDAN